MSVRSPIESKDDVLFEPNYKSTVGNTHKIIQEYISKSHEDQRKMLVMLNKNIDNTLLSISSTSDLSNMASLFVHQGYPVTYEKICARIRANSIMFTTFTPA